MLLSVGGTVLAVIMFCTGISMFRGKEKGYGLFVITGSIGILLTSLFLLTNDYPIPGFITIFFFLYCAPFALYSFLSKQTVSKKGALTAIIVYGLVCASFLLVILYYRKFSLLFALPVLLFGLLNYFIIGRRFQKKSRKLVKESIEPNQHNSSSNVEINKKKNISNVVLSKGAYMKEKLQGVLGIFGIILYYLFTALLTVAPLISLGLPWWVDFIILLVVQLFPPIDIAFYIWALIVTVQGPQDWWAIVFYVCFGLFILFTIVPLILKLFKPRKKVKERAEQIQIDVESEEPADEHDEELEPEDEHDEELPVPEKGYMFCRKCGAKIPGDSDFCPKCGKSTKYKVKKKSSIKKIIISSLLLIFILALGTFLVFAFTREKSYCIGSFDLSEIPEFKGKPFVVLNNNKPYFNTKTVPDEPYEHYSPLDNRGRSGVCETFICKEIMPNEFSKTIAEDIGLNNIRAYLLIPERFNRETFSNERVVFFATDFLVYSGKIVFEDQIYEYVTSTGNGVFYRVTPVYLADRNNICSGVILEAYSPTDNGNGVCFNVYCYNVQPGEDFSYQQEEKVDSYRLKKWYSTK